MQGWCYCGYPASSIVQHPCNLIISNPLFQTLLALFVDYMYRYFYSIAFAQFSEITCKEKGKKNVITSVYVNMSIQLQSKVLPVIPCYGMILYSPSS